MKGFLGRVTTGAWVSLIALALRETLLDDVRRLATESQRDPNSSRGTVTA
jgi:hypothetical protein